MRRGRLEVASTWDGEELPADERVVLDLALGEASLRVEVSAPFHGDPAPSGPPGPTDRLWEREVVELFLLGTDERYLELELGPYGHHLVLRLRGRRRIEEQGLPLAYAVERVGARWHGRARLPALWLPPGLVACNAYAIHGVGAARRHCAAFPVPGPAPDFHRLERFGPLPWAGSGAGSDAR
jgi:hypothetical protein